MAALIVGVVLGVVGCSSSPPARFYTLSVKPPQGAAPVAAGQVVVAAVSIPGELDRPEMVRRTGPNQISIAELDRWAAPLEETVRRVLSDDISRRSSPGVGEPQRPVSVDILEFFGDASCNVTLRAVWTLKQTGAVPATEDIQVPAGGSACPASLPEAMSVALGQLSDRIVAGVAKVPPAAASVK